MVVARRAGRLRCAGLLLLLHSPACSSFGGMTLSCNPFDAGKLRFGIGHVAAGQAGITPCDAVTRCVNGFENGVEKGGNLCDQGHGCAGNTACTALANAKAEKDA
eukprot:gene37414-65034_t